MNTPPPLRILTVNTHKGFSFLNRRFILAKLRDAIIGTGADIVFLQEVTGENTRQARRIADWPDDPHHHFIAGTDWPETAYGRNAIYPHGHHGNAILSRWPLDCIEQRDCSTNRFEQRGFLYARLSLPGIPALHCICIHLGLSSISRLKQLRMIADFVHASVPATEPLIVAGDFNDWTGRNSRSFAKALELTSVVTGPRGGHARTFPAWRPVLPLDRIYLRGLAPLSTDILRTGPWARLSDHAALFAEVTTER